MTERNRVFVIALDGADPDLMHEWADQGLLPNIARLRERATWCRVDNPPGLFAGAICPSFYTGVSPARHGKFCSTQMKSGTYDFGRVQNHDRRCPTLWDELARQGKRVAVIDAPKSYVSENLNGLQIVDWAAEDFAIELGTCPPELAADVERQYGRNEIVEIAVAREGFEGLARLGPALLERLRNKVRMSEDVLARDDWDFFFTLLTEVHSVGHLAWHLHDRSHPRYDEQQAERIGDLVKDVYVATDAALERFVAMADERTHVMVYSINGMGPSHTGNHLLDTVLYAADLETLPAARRGLTRAADLVHRLTPGPIADAIAPLQRAARQALSLGQRDRSRRRAFRVPSNSVAGGVRVNLVGREPQGIVPRDEYEPLCRQLRDLMASLRDADSGEAVARRVHITHELYDGPHLDELPDVLVEWTQAAPVTSVWSPATGRVERAFAGHRTGDHKPDGILYAVNGAAGRGEVERVSIYDLAPTIAAMVGARFPEAEGRDVSAHLGAGATA